MKRLLSYTFLACFALSAIGASAQTKPGRGLKNPKGTQLQRQNKGNANLDADHKLMREAGRDCKEAQHLMNAALPIYNGHRHRAIEINKVSIQEIHAAFVWTPNSPKKANNVQQLLANIGNGNEGPASKYTQAQIDRSNDLMRKALAKLQAAVSVLGKIQGSYGGYIGEAGQLVNLSIQEVNEALGTSPRP